MPLITAISWHVLQLLASCPEEGRGEEAVMLANGYFTASGVTRRE
jgi:hypothetical protein